MALTIIHYIYILCIYVHSVDTNRFKIQWNPSNVDTNGVEESVLYREVSLFKGLKCMQEWYILGATKSVPFREVSSIQGCPYRGVPLYTY